jgi:hypothetical protein
MFFGIQIPHKKRERIALLARVRKCLTASGDAVECLWGGRLWRGDRVEPVAVRFVTEDKYGGCWEKGI